MSDSSSVYLNVPAALREWAVHMCEERQGRGLSTFETMRQEMAEFRASEGPDVDYGQFMVKVPDEIHAEAMDTLLRAHPEMVGFNWNVTVENHGDASGPAPGGGIPFAKFYLSGGAAFGALMGKIEESSDLDFNAIFDAPGDSSEDVAVAAEWLEMHLDGNVRVNTFMNRWRTPYATTFAGTWYNQPTDYMQGSELAKTYGGEPEDYVPSGPDANEDGIVTKDFIVSVLRKMNWSHLSIVKNYDISVCQVVMSDEGCWVSSAALWAIATKRIDVDAATWKYASYERTQRYLVRTGWTAVRSMKSTGKPGIYPMKIDFCRNTFVLSALGPVVRIGYGAIQLVVEDEPEGSQSTKPAWAWTYGDYANVFKTIAAGLHYDSDNKIVLPKIVWKKGEMCEAVNDSYNFKYEDIGSDHRAILKSYWGISNAAREKIVEELVLLDGVVSEWPTQEPEWVHPDVAEMPKDIFA